MAENVSERLVGGLFFGRSFVGGRLGGKFLGGSSLARHRRLCRSFVGSRLGREGMGGRLVGSRFRRNFFSFGAVNGSLNRCLVGCGDGRDFLASARSAAVWAASLSAAAFAA